MTKLFFFLLVPLAVIVTIAAFIIDPGATVMGIIIFAIGSGVFFLVATVLGAILFRIFQSSVPAWYETIIGYIIIGAWLTFAVFGILYQAGPDSFAQDTIQLTKNIWNEFF